MTTLSQSIHRSVDGAAVAALTRAEYKRMRITAALSAICIIIAISYLITDLSNNVHYSIPGYAILFVSSVVVFFLLKKSLFLPAKVLLAITINMVVFYASLTDPFES